MRDYINLSARLMIICVVAAVLLAITFGATQGVIAQKEEEAATLARQEVLPSAKSFVRQDIAAIQAQYPNVNSIHVALNGQDVVGYAVSLQSKGYGGNIILSVGMDADFVLSGVRIGTHTETAGLGAKITLQSFYAQFDGKKAPLEVKKDIIPISGATISSKGVTQGVNLACELIRDNAASFQLTPAQ